MFKLMSYQEHYMSLKNADFFSNFRTSPWLSICNYFIFLPGSHVIPKVTYPYSLKVLVSFTLVSLVALGNKPRELAVSVKP